MVVWKYITERVADVSFSGLDPVPELCYTCVVSQSFWEEIDDSKRIVNTALAVKQATDTIFRDGKFTLT